MLKNVPGHVRAFTWMLVLSVSAAPLLGSKGVDAVFGAVLLVFGAFLGDQATHLNQEAHSSPPPTWIEQVLQKHRAASVIVGLILAGIGSFLMTS